MEAIPVQRARIGWRFWIYWMLATIGGGALYVIASIPLNMIMAQVLPPDEVSQPPSGIPVVFLLIMLLSGGLLGACIGLVQALVLRRELDGMRRWIVATTIGFAAGGLLRLVNVPEMDMLGPVYPVLQFGLIPAIFQWLALRGRVFQAGWWILATLVGWVLAFILIGIAIGTGLYVEPFDLLCALLVPAGTAGAGMVWMLRRTAPTSGIINIT
jgi:hypothetical protein